MLGLWRIWAWSRKIELISQGHELKASVALVWKCFFLYFLIARSEKKKLFEKSQSFRKVALKQFKIHIDKTPIELSSKSIFNKGDSTCKAQLNEDVEFECIELQETNSPEPRFQKTIESPQIGIIKRTRNDHPAPPHIRIKHGQRVRPKSWVKPTFKPSQTHHKAHENRLSNVFSHTRPLKRPSRLWFYQLSFKKLFIILQNLFHNSLNLSFELYRIWS